MTENKLSLPSDFFIREVRPVREKLRELIEFRGYEEVTLDFTKTHLCFPDAMLPIISAARKCQIEGVRFRMVPRQYEPLRRTFVSSNWAYLLDPRHFDVTDDQRPDRMPAQLFTDSSEQHRIVNEILERVLRVTPFLQRNHLRALEWSNQ